jgi:diphosphomevalonate decarboxylase
MKATAEAFANIALAKYWGKSDVALNLPAVPSLSLTLDPLRTQTRVEFDASLTHDELLLNDTRGAGRTLARVVHLLENVRKEAGFGTFARVESHNHFPTASGLASSASGFAALAIAARAAASLPFDRNKASALARQASASAARSVFGGFVVLAAGQHDEATLCAQPIFERTHWDLRVVVAVTTEGEKETGSTLGMEHSRTTSPYYEAWVANAPLYFERVLEGVRTRDLELAGEAMEESTFAMHACALAASPGILYFTPSTLAAYETVKSLRKNGVCAYATMDAGPHVKVFCDANDVDRVNHALLQTSGVLRTITASPGRGAELIQP